MTDEQKADRNLENPPKSAAGSLSEHIDQNIEGVVAVKDRDDPQATLLQQAANTAAVASAIEEVGLTNEGEPRRGESFRGRRCLIGESGSQL